MKEQETIPTSKIKRSGKLLGTGIKLGGNYLKYYAKKAVIGTTNKDELDKANADDIFDTLSELKGSALKAAQMLSMDQGILPEAFREKFQLAQYSAPALSYALITRTFKKHFGKRPTDLFDEFSRSAIHAASIGQVHAAMIGDQKLAVKIQYPGVADSVSNDLKMVKPLAGKLTNMSRKEVNYYMDEVESKLLEETDYNLELEQSLELQKACGDIENVIFPHYYPELSCDKVITMDWIEGMHINEWIQTNPSQDQRNKIGQALWDFYNFQIHTLKLAHADPHPGNFLVTPDLKLAIIDFGCVKFIPEDFYSSFFKLMNKDVLKNREQLMKIYLELNMIHESDSNEEIEMFTNIYKDLIEHLARPYYEDDFDFSDGSFLEEIYELGNQVLGNRKIWKSNLARGKKDGIYVNRIYLGLYAILHELKAQINTKRFKPIH